MVPRRGRSWFKEGTKRFKNREESSRERELQEIDERIDRARSGEVQETEERLLRSRLLDSEKIVTDLLRISRYFKV